ncbi:MAG: FAD-dependent oxidoreductase [Bdellovibrionia bacterium]
MELNELTSEEIFQDFKPALTATDATTEANRCLYCYDAPCIIACPTEINIPQFIGRIGAGNTHGAAKTILDSNILGHSCASACPTEVLCEGACVYNSLNHKPIMIGKLQRYAVGQAYKDGVQFYTPGPATGKRVALIGAGPASLACAHELRKYGHETVIYEKTHLPGGLNTYGIAPYKMKVGVSLGEIRQISAMGVKFQFEQELGKELKLEKLLETYDTVFLGLGLGSDTFPDIKGSDAPEVRSRVRGATELIAELKTAPQQQMEWIKSIGTALVIGGGNTALDACRELKGLGIPNVIGSYRRGEAEMSGYAHELKAARQEGVEFQFHTLPLQITPLKSETNSPPQFQVRILKTNLPFEKQIQKSKPSGDSPEAYQLSVGLVVVATGQSKLEGLLAKIPGLQFEKGRLLTDPKTGITGNPRIYAGGDLANGGMEVVNAVAEGKRAALAIHRQLLKAN